MNRRIIAGVGLVAVLALALAFALRSGAGDAGPAAGDAPIAIPSTAAQTEPSTSATPPPEPVTTTAPLPDSTAASTTTVVVDPDAPPVPDTGELTDAEQIWAALLAYHNWAFQHPGDAELDRYLDPRCSCADFIGEQIAELTANGWREDDEGIVLDRVEVNVQSGDGIVMDVYDRHVEQRIVDGSGAVVRTVPARELSRFAVTLVLDDSLGWRIFDWQFVSSMGEA